MISLFQKKSINSEFSPELILLLSCLPLSKHSKYVKDSNLLEEYSIDWNYFLKLTRFHKLFPPVYQYLKQSNDKNIPDHVLANLRKNTFEITLKNVLYVKELRWLINLFEINGISVIPFKGPTLAQLAYGSIYSRQFCDLDLLVRRNDFEQSMNLLINHHYRSSYIRQEWNKSIFHRLIKYFHYRFITHEISFGKKRDENNVFIDLHRNISKYSLECFEIFYDRLVKTNLLEQSIQSLRPEDLLNVLCIHNSQDGWIKIQSIYDIANLVHNNPDLNWPNVFKQAQLLRCRRRLLLGLALCQNYFEINLSESIRIKIIEDQIISDLISKIDQGFKINPTSKRTFVMKIRFQILRMKMLESCHFKLKLLGDFIWSYFFSNFYRAKIMTTPLSK